MMETVPVAVRFEYKFINHATLLYSMDGWITKHAAGFRTTYPPRFINNVYFDSWAYQAYWGNASGQTDRTKVRYRWYGDLLNPPFGTLEVKRRLNQMGWKEHYKIDVPVFETETTMGPPRRWSSIRSDIRRNLPAGGRKWFDASPRPILINRYWRQYWQSQDQKVRLTLDSQEKVFDQRLSAKPNLAKAVNLPHIVIVEIKCDREDREAGVEVAESCPLRPSRHSKYIKGLMASTQVTSSAQDGFLP
jgi:hypothetical protein